MHSQSRLALISAPTPSSGVGVAHGEGDVGAGGGERASGLDADARRAARDDHALVPQVDACDHFGSGGRGGEGTGDAALGHGRACDRCPRDAAVRGRTARGIRPPARWRRAHHSPVPRPADACWIAPTRARACCSVIVHSGRPRPRKAIAQLGAATRLRGRERVSSAPTGVAAGVRRPVVGGRLVRAVALLRSMRVCLPSPHIPLSGESTRGARESALAATRLPYSRPLTRTVRVGLAEGSLAPGRSRWLRAADPVLGPIAHRRPRAATRRTGGAGKQR